jgi:hemoglobin
MTESTIEEAKPSHFDRVGGAPAIRATVDRLYELILADPSLSGYFDDVDMAKQKGHMAALLTTVLGGPDRYAGRDLGVAHQGLGITTAQYQAVAGYLVQTLEELNVPQDIIADAGAVVTQVAPTIIEDPEPATGEDG